MMVCGDRWRGFKTQLTNDYITNPSKDCRHPLVKYPFLQKDIWEKFVESRKTPEFKEKSQKGRDTVANNLYPHTLSRGGYDYLEDKMMDEKRKRMEDSGEFDHILSPPSRHDKWKRARQKKGGEYTTEATRVVAEKIGFLGLSGAILIQVYRTVFNNKPVSYLLMLSLLPPINTLILMWFVRIHDTHHEGESEKKYLNIFSLMALVIAAYLMIVIILDNILTLQLSIRIFTFVVLMVLLASLLCITFKAHENNFSNSASESFLAEGSNLIAREDSSNNPLPADDTNRQRTLQQGGNLNLFQAMKTLNFWILFVSMACGMGSGLATVNNMSQIGESLGYSTLETGSLVALWSIWNFLGRFGAGYVSDYFLHTRGWARPFFMVITLMTMSIGHVVIAYGLPGALYVGSILVGICYGSQWSLMPTITSEIFGVGHMGSIFNTITIASPVGSYIFSVRVLGYIYDKEASEEGNICVGTHCFMLSFLIMASATIVGSWTALCLFLRTRQFYGQVVLRRIQNNL